MLTPKKIVRALIVAAVASFLAGVLASQTQADGGARLTAYDAFGGWMQRSYLYSSFVLSGSLLDGSGNPVRATVFIHAWPYAGGAVPAWITHTDSRGHYVFRVPRGPSRLVAVNAAGAAQFIHETVTAGLWLKVTSYRNRRLVFSGGVLVDRSAAMPPFVLLQDDTPSGWRTFGVAVPNPRSHWFRYTYRADRSTEGYTFAFRLRSSATAAWGTGTSNEARARIW
jgi:hypothetical protein